MTEAMDAITAHLERMANGEEDARNYVFHRCYEDLKRRAMRLMDGQSGGHTLQPTAVVHEAFLKLTNGEPVQCRNREHFFAVAATAMRQVLIDHARARKQEKRGGDRIKLALDDVIDWFEGRSVDLLLLDELLSEMKSFDARMARAVEYRFFGGLTVKETSALLDIPLRTYEREWRAAKAWLAAKLK